MDDMDDHTTSDAALDVLRSLPAGSRVQAGTFARKYAQPYGFLRLRTRWITEEAPQVWYRRPDGWVRYNGHWRDDLRQQDSAHLASLGEITVLFRAEPAPCGHRCKADT